MPNLRLFTVTTVSVCVFAVTVAAEPPIWESNFGSELTSLTGMDDEAEEVFLTFSFPFGGTLFTNIFAGTNGAVALGGLGEADDYPSGDEFIDTVDPMIAPFWSDMDLGSMGTIHFNDFGDRGVFTWNEIGSFENEDAPFTFQLQLFQDGRIIFGYNGISEINSDNLDENVHVGLTQGNLPSFPTEIDYSADAPFTSGNSLLELFEYEVPESFDLDMFNIVFTPLGNNNAADGYQVTVVPGPASGFILACGLLTVRRRRR